MSVRLALTNDQGETLFARRVSVELDQPTRDGDRTIHILTNLPATAADALKVAQRTKRSKILHNITPTQGWFQDPTVADVASNLLAGVAKRSLCPS